jgi:hypothetical protein
VSDFSPLRERMLVSELAHGDQINSCHFFVACSFSSVFI